MSVSKVVPASVAEVVEALQSARPHAARLASAAAELWGAVEAALAGAQAKAVT